MTSSFAGGSVLLRYLSLLAVVVICSTVACAANNTYNIYPACHDDDTECLTLSDIVTDVSRYFVNSTTLVFHHGDHNLPDVDVFVTDVNNLTLRSSNSSSARILGSNSSFSFSNTSALQIESIKFISCRMELYSTDTKLDSCWFEKCTAEIGGAVAMYNESNVYFTGDTVFVGNSATRKGAAVSSDSSTLVFSGSTTFSNNTSEYDGGALAVHKSIVTVSGYSSFTSNSAVNRGGAAFIDVQNNVIFYGTSTFVGNTARIGGAVRIVDHNNVSFDGTNVFLYNEASDFGGAVLAYFVNTLIFSGNNYFFGNSAYNGGALYNERNNSIYCIGNCNFIGNYAAENGGAVLGHSYDLVSFIGNSNFVENFAQFGGGLCAEIHILVEFIGVSCFTGNFAHFGGAVSVEGGSSVGISGIVNVSSNKAIYGGGIFVQGGMISVNGTGLFRANSAHGQYGGALHAVSSIVSLAGNYTLMENEATFGGAMAFSGLAKRVLFLHNETHVSFVGNTALREGGAIHVDDNPFTYCLDKRTTIMEPCFFQVQHEDCVPRFDERGFPSNFGRNLSFVNNSAPLSGNTMYGGNLQNCGVCYTRGIYFKTGEQVLKNLTGEPDLSALDIASGAMKVFPCNNNMVPDFSTSSMNFTKYPGQTLSLHVVAVGQLNGVVPSDIHADAVGVELPSEFITQFTENKTCTQVHYPLHIKSHNESAMLTLYAYEPCYRTGFPLSINVTFLPCPTGFSLSNHGECTCDKRLQHYTDECVITNEIITRPKNHDFWVGVDSDDVPQTQGLILHPHCPFDYCREVKVDFQLNNTDAQCRKGRSGLLCGQCRPGYSLALGSSQCIPDCSDEYLSLLVGFGVAGLSLVGFLFLCNLTVAQGTISGLIFYANILAINQTVFFPSGHHNILTVFIAWVNLDLGIETCFFKGLDMYTKTWLQFAFPFYIWLLVWLIIGLAKISGLVSKLIVDTNPVAVLATLVLLSYTKLLRAVMTSFAFTKLSYRNGESRIVWLYDGNVGFLDGKHIVLFLFSLLVLLAFFIPYTLLLLCGQWIQSSYQPKWLSSSKQLYLKSFFDAYFAPHKDKHCYWTGLLLLVRFLVLVMSTIINVNTPQDPYTNLLVMLTIVSCLLAWIGHGVYKKWYLDALEASYLLNLIVLMGGTYQVRLSGGNQEALAFTSTGIAFLGFLVVVFALLRKRLRKACFRELANKIRHPHRKDYSDMHDVLSAPSEVPVTIVEISAQEMVDSSKFRESTLMLVSSDNAGVI